MKITKSQKEQITKNIHAINEMDHSKLILFVQQLYLSKPQMNKTVFEFTLRACDIQMANLKEETTVSPLLVMSEFGEGDLK